MQICMDVDTALAEVPVNILPLIDDTDFKTIEDAVVFNQAGLALFWNFVTTAGVQTCTAVTPTSAGDYDWTDQGASGMYAIEIPASGGASINNDTEGFGWFTGVATGILPWRGPVICFRAAALNNSLVDAGTTGLLAPTVAARTLDVTATGAAGIDWANVENPTTAVDLSGTNIDVDQVVASVSGAVGSVTGAVGSVTGAVGSVTGNVGGNVVGDVQGNVDGSVASVSGNIGGLAAGAITDVENAVWDATLASHVAAGSTGEALSNASSAGDPWATALPGAYGAGTAGFILGTNLDALVSSRLAPTVAARTLDVSVAGNAGIDWANVENPTTALNLSGTNIDVDQVVASVSGAVGSVTGAVGSVTGNVGGNVTGSVGSIATGGITAASFAADAIDAAALAADAVAEIADGVWDEPIAGHLTAGSTGLALNSASSAGDPWATALPGAYGAGTAGSLLGRVPDVAAGAAGGLFIAGSNAATSIATALTANVIGNITGNLSGSVGSVTGAVGSVTGAVGSVTGDLGGNVNGNVLGSVGSVTGAVGSVTGNVGGNVVGSVGSLAAQAKLDVNAEVVDVLSVDTFAEPTGIPPATTTLALKIGRLHQALRNGLTVTATDKTFTNDAGADLWKKPLSDDGTTYTEGEGVTP